MRTRNGRGDGVRLRTEIVAAATSLIDRSCSVTLRAVARAADISTSSIYPHFPDCPAILLAVCRTSFADLVPRLELAADIRAAGDAYLEFAALHPRRYRLMYGNAAQFGEPVVRLFTRILTDCVRTGRSTSTDPAADAVTLWLGLHGLADQRAAIRRSPRFTELVPRLIASLAHI